MDRGIRALTASCLLLGVATAAVVDAELGGSLVGGPVLTLATVVGSYLVGAWLAPAAAGVTGLGAVSMLTVANQVADPGRYTAANDAFFFAVLVGGVALTGNVVSARAAQVRELRAASALREEQRVKELEAARLEERTRVDAGVTRSMMQRMSALVVQASGLRREEASARDREAVARVESGGRETLEELRAVLDALHEPTEPVERPAPVESRTSAPGRREPGLGWVDVLVALSGIPVAVETVAVARSHPAAVGDVVVGAALGVPLAWRRGHPMAASATFLLLAVLMTSLLTPLAGTVTILLPLSLAAYALGAHTRGAARAAALALLLGGGLLVSVAGSPADASDGLLPSLVWLGLAWGAGVLSAQHSDRAARLVDLLAQVEAGREDEVRLAVAEQRQAIAHDLHDTVAHAMTVVCLHAEAAQQHWSDDDVVEGSLAIVETAAREAMGHLRTGLGMLETDAATTDEMAVETRAFAASLGVPVTVLVEADLSPAERALARRVLREALVNAARHAPGAAAEVRIAHESDCLVVEVRNAPAESQDFTSGSRRGLAHLGELLAARGGKVQHGPTRQGGYVVTAYAPAHHSRVPA